MTPVDIARVFFECDNMTKTIYAGHNGETMKLIRVTNASIDGIFACLTDEDLHWGGIRNPGRQDNNPQVVVDGNIKDVELLTGSFHSLFHKNKGDWLIRPVNSPW